MDTEKLLQLRFEERDKEFSAQLVAVKRDMAARGLLNSGNMIVKGHEALVEEFRVNCSVIIDTYIDAAKLMKIAPDVNIVLPLSKATLKGRRETLEGIYKSQMNNVISSLQNNTMLAPYSDLSGVYDLNEREMEIGLSKRISEMEHRAGVTLFERVKNKAYNNPLVVIAVITISVVTSVLAFVKLLYPLISE